MNVWYLCLFMLWTRSSAIFQLQIGWHDKASGLPPLPLLAFISLSGNLFSLSTRTNPERKGAHILWFLSYFVRTVRTLFETRLSFCNYFAINFKCNMQSGISWCNVFGLGYLQIKGEAITFVLRPLLLLSKSKNDHGRMCRFVAIGVHNCHIGSFN